MAEGIVTGEDGRKRCFWGAGPEYVAYHDLEWGRPVSDDHRLFEKICLEGFQSGLSWLTILRKRKNFRAAFAEFDFVKVAKFGAGAVERLLKDAGIVRHRGKIESTINNAKRAEEIVGEFGSLAAFFWQFEPKRKPGTVDRAALGGGPSEEAVALSKELKRRGWTFVGPTTVHAFMQAMGLVNEHLTGCFCRTEVAAERRAFRRPAVRG